MSKKPEVMYEKGSTEDINAAKKVAAKRYAKNFAIGVAMAVATHFAQEAIVNQINKAKEAAKNKSEEK